MRGRKLKPVPGFHLVTPGWRISIPIRSHRWPPPSLSGSARHSLALANLNANEGGIGKSIVCIVGPIFFPKLWTQPLFRHGFQRIGGIPGRATGPASLSSGGHAARSPVGSRPASRRGRSRRPRRGPCAAGHRRPPAGPAGGGVATPPPVPDRAHGPAAPDRPALLRSHALHQIRAAWPGWNSPRNSGATRPSHGLPTACEAMR